MVPPQCRGTVSSSAALLVRFHYCGWEVGVKAESCGAFGKWGTILRREASSSPELSA